MIIIPPKDLFYLNANTTLNKWKATESEKWFILPFFNLSGKEFILPFFNLSGAEL